MSPTETQPAWQQRLSVRWRDLDSFNHVNNSNYLSYLEDARVHWLQGLAPDWATHSSLPVLASSQLNFRAPITWPAEVWIKLYIERIGNTSLTLSHRIESDDGRVLHCDGSVTLVWVDRQNGRPCTLPAVISALSA